MKRLALLLIALLSLPAVADAVPPVYPTENCTLTGANLPATLSTGYFYLRDIPITGGGGGNQRVEVAPDGCLIHPNAITQFAGITAIPGVYLLPYDMVLTLPVSSTTATNITQTAWDAHQGIGDTSVSGTLGSSLIMGSSGFVPSVISIQPGTLATAAASTFIQWQYATASGWVNVDSTGANVGKPFAVDTASTAAACTSNYCYDKIGVDSWGVTATGTYARAGATNSNTVELFQLSQTCGTVGSNCWTPAAFVKVDLGASPYSYTGVADGTITAATNANPIVITTTTPPQSGTKVTIAGVGGNTAANGTWTATRLTATTFSIPASGNGVYTSGGTFDSWRWYVRAVVAGASFTTMPANMLAQISELSSPALMMLKRYGGSGGSSLQGYLNGSFNSVVTTPYIKMQNDIVPSLINAGINSTGEGEIPIIDASTGDGGITVNSNAILPGEYNLVTTEWAMGRPGPSPVIPPVKDLSANMTGYCASSAVLSPDVFDPGAQNSFNLSQQYQFSKSTYSGGGLHATFDGTKIWGIETDEGDLTPGLDTPTHAYPVEIIATSPVGNTVQTAFFTPPAPAAGQFTTYTKTFGWRDTLLNEYECSAAGLACTNVSCSTTTAAALCTGAGKGTYSADPAADGSAPFDGLTYIGATLATNGLARLNASWGLATPGSPACTSTPTTVCNTQFTTWNTSDANGLAGIANGGANYTSYGSGTGLLDENGKRTVATCGLTWFPPLSNPTLVFQNWGSGTATHIFNDLQAFIKVYAGKWMGEIRSAYDATLGSTTVNATRPPMICTLANPPDVVMQGLAQYCDIALIFDGITTNPGTVLSGNNTEDASVMTTNMTGWQADSYNNNGGKTLAFADLDFLEANGDAPMSLDLEGQTASTNCQITGVTTTSVTAENCPVVGPFTRGLYSPDTTGAANCPDGLGGGGLMNPIYQVTAVDYQFNSTTWTLGVDTTAGSPPCFGVGHHLQSGTPGQAIPGTGGNAALWPSVDFNSWALASTGHYNLAKAELDVKDPGNNHNFMARIYWDLFPDQSTNFSANSQNWGYLDFLGNLNDGVEDTAAGGCSATVGTCSNANCVDLAYKNSAVLCDPLGYPTGGDGPLLALYPGNSGSMGNRIGQTCTLAATSGCGIDLKAIQYMINNDPIGSGSSVGPQSYSGVIF